MFKPLVYRSYKLPITYLDPSLPNIHSTGGIGISTLKEVFSESSGFLGALKDSDTRNLIGLPDPLLFSILEL